MTVSLAGVFAGNHQTLYQLNLEDGAIHLELDQPEGTLSAIKPYKDKSVVIANELGVMIWMGVRSRSDIISAAKSLSLLD